MFALEKVADPKFFAENRMPAHSDHVFYANFLELERRQSSFTRSLDGIWYFHYAKNPGQRTLGFETMYFDVEGWDTIHVPAHWQLEGWGHPHYTNQTYPWDGHEVVHPGEIPLRENPVGEYVKEFILPEGWERDAVLTLHGAESAVAVYLNGHYVGYSEDSFTPASFDLTPYLLPGKNRLALEVFRYSAGSWLEDQDFFRFSGIFRKVILTHRPLLHIEDIRVTATPVHAYRDGRLALSLRWSNALKRRVVYSLTAPDGTVIFTRDQELDRKLSSFEAEVENAALWSAEHPNLYHLVLSIYDEKDALIEVIPLAVGFRAFQMEAGIMKINGKRIVFKGVNRHEFDCDRGRAIDPANIEEDIRIMKRYNINALRCSHYPNTSELYRLCDLYGLYVIDETNLETHGTWMKNGACYPDDETLPNDCNDWEGAVLDRAKSMLERDKNHPCIVIWSCGNESYGGSILFHMSEYFRKADPTRLVHYEGIFWDRRYKATSDMESQMYPTVADIKKFLSKHREKPFICCEYTHAMGNSIGGMHLYTDLTDEDERYQGGFIWDFVDQAIRFRGRYGQDVFGYGGDFGDRPHDGHFSGDGIVFADRTLTSKLQEVKYNYQDYTLHVEKDSVRIQNKSLFTNTEEYELHLELTLNGTLFWETTMPAPAIAAGQEGSVTLELPILDIGEACLTASLRLKKDKRYAARGHEVAFGQGIWHVEQVEPMAEPMLLPVCSSISCRQFYTAEPLLEERDEKPLRIVHGDIDIGVEGDGFSFLFSGALGNLVSYRVGDREMLEDAPQPSFWRAPVDNDYGSRRDFSLAQWKLASLYRRLIKKEVRAEDGLWESCVYFGQLGQKEYKAHHIELRFTYELATNPLSVCVVTYKVCHDGSLSVALDYEKVEGLPELPDFAMVFPLSADYRQLRYYGYGPLDNYADRRRGARLGIFKGTVADAVEPYLFPQDCGNHTGVRWMEVADRKGRGLRLTATAPMEASALPYSAHELEQARHPYDLPPVHHTFLRASLGEAGVGGDDTWGAPVLPAYTVPNTTKHFAFYLKGF